VRVDLVADRDALKLLALGLQAPNAEQSTSKRLTVWSTRIVP
jgi:hypothetical protein